MSDFQGLGAVHKVKWRSLLADIDGGFGNAISLKVYLWRVIFRASFLVHRQPTISRLREKYHSDQEL